MTSAESIPTEKWPIVRGLLLGAVTAAVMVALYYLLPLGRRSDGFAVFELVIGLLLLAVVIAWQLRAIIRSDYPVVRAAQVLTVTTPLFLLLFAAQYFVTSQDDPSAFTERSPDPTRCTSPSRFSPVLASATSRLGWGRRVLSSQRRWCWIWWSWG